VPITESPVHVFITTMHLSRSSSSSTLNTLGEHWTLAWSGSERQIVRNGGYKEKNLPYFGFGNLETLA